MENVWRVLGVILIIMFVMIACLAYVLITKKEKHYIFCSIVLSILILACVTYIIPPYVMDLCKQETKIVTIVYDGCSSGREIEHDLYFIKNGNRITLCEPIGTNYRLKLKEGQAYTVEYFVHSKIIKNVSLYE